MNRLFVGFAALALLLGAVSQARADLAIDCAYADTRHSVSTLPDLTATYSEFMIPAGLGIDSAVIRVRNTGTTAVTITSLLVDGFYNGATTATGGIGDSGNTGPLTWTFPITLAAGESVVFGQTAAWNFDASETNILNVNMNSGATPGVHFTFGDGSSFSFTDTAQILNAGGNDYPGSALQQNESVDWVTCATVASVPEPSSLTLLGVGALGLFGFRRWRKRAAA